MIRFLLVLSWLPMLIGCRSMPSKMTTDPTFMASEDYQLRKSVSASLFATDEAVLSGGKIEEILSSKVAIPQKARLAILQFGIRRDWEWWSEDTARMSEEMEKGALRKLRSCPRFIDVSLLPAMMAPEKQTIPYLREAAARYQADLLLVYRFRYRTYDKYRVFSPDKVKAKCVVEAILLIVRTGIVPFASAAAREQVAERSKEDYNYSETIAKAQMSAVSAGLEQIAADLVQFISGIP